MLTSGNGIDLRDPSNSPTLGLFGANGTDELARITGDAISPTTGQLIFSVLIGYSVFADESNIKSGWQIEVEYEHIAIRREGIVTHGDDILFALSKNNCNKMSWFTKFYTMERSVSYDENFKEKLKKRTVEFDPILDKHLVFQIKNLNDIEDIGYITAEVMTVNDFLSGHRAFIYFGTYDTSSYLQWFRQGDIWEFRMVQANEYLINTELIGFEQINEINTGKSNVTYTYLNPSTRKKKTLRIQDRSVIKYNEEVKMFKCKCSKCL